MKYDYEEIKIGRKVTAIKFYIKTIQKRIWKLITRFQLL
ncbi:hypothetical protein [Clostridium rhizosphaerae]